MNQIFDRDIKITFYIGDSPADTISVPATGIKPAISIMGKYVTAQVVQNVALRITNFYPSVALSEYTKIRIEAGYKKSLDRATIEGEVKLAYKESPSPDGVTFFSLLTGRCDGFFNALVNSNYYQTGTRLSVFSDILNAISKYTNQSWVLENGIQDAALPKNFNRNCTVKDLLADLKMQWGVMYAIEGNTLVLFDPKKGRTGAKTIEINYLSSPPTAAANGITFTAPWMPEILPGRNIKIASTFGAQNFGFKKLAESGGLNQELIVQTVDFNFSTVAGQNTMTVLALNTQEAQGV